jgi:hypothetical protein
VAHSSRPGTYVTGWRNEPNPPPHTTNERDGASASYAIREHPNPRTRPVSDREKDRPRSRIEENARPFPDTRTHCVPNKEDDARERRFDLRAPRKGASRKMPAWATASTGIVHSENRSARPVRISLDLRRKEPSDRTPLNGGLSRCIAPNPLQLYRGPIDGALRGAGVPNQSGRLLASIRLDPLSLLGFFHLTEARGAPATVGFPKRLGKQESSFSHR